MKDLKPTNRYRKVLIENIVFLRGDDFLEFLDEKERFEAIFEDEFFNEINYLLQWYHPGEHSQDWYNAKNINTELLGRLKKIEEYSGYFLFSKNTSIGYIGLSRIVEFSPKIID